MADTAKYIQAQKFSLSVGAATTDTTITLTSFNFPDGTAIASGDVGTLTYGTLEPGTSREEQISFTGFTTNADGTVTLTGVTRGLGFGAADTYSEQSDLKKQHGAGATFIISNTAAFYDGFVNKGNDETITGTLSVPTPTSGSHAATKDYVDAAASGNQLAYDRIVVAATAGESLASGDLVYFDDTDNEWKKTDATSATTINGVLLGIAQGTGSDGGAIAGGVLTYGLDTTQAGMTVGVKLYASDTAGAIAESAGTTERVVGFSKSATELYFDPHFESIPSQEQQNFLNATTGMISMYGGSTAPTGFLLCNGQAVSRTTYANLFAVTSTSYGDGDGSTTFNVPDLRARFPLGYSGGAAPTKTFTFEDADVNTSTDVITVDDNQYLYTGQAVALTTTGTLPTGLSATTYYVIYVSDTTIKLATSRANADNGTAVDITAAAGGGTHTLTLTLTQRDMGDNGGEESHTIQTEELASHTHTYPTENGAGSAATLNSTASTGSNASSATGGDTPHNNMPPYVTVNYIIKT